MDQEDKASYELQVRPVSHKIRVTFFLEEGKLAATDEVHLQRLADAWDDVRFVLWHQLEINELLIDGQPAQYTYGLIDRGIYREVILAKAEFPQIQQQVDVTVSYVGRPFYEHGGILMATINPEIASLNPSFFPWYPQFNRSINSTADVIFVVPMGYTVVASGELVDVKTRDDDWEEWMWHTNISGERFSFAIAQYRCMSTHVDDVAVSVHFLGEHDNRMDVLFEEVKAIFTFCSERLGKYPLEKFAIAELPNSLRGAGGYGEESFIKLKLDPLKSVKSGGFAHEIAHAWVLRATHERGGLWLLESLGEYVSYLYEEATGGPDIAQNIRAFWATRYFELISEIDDYPLIDYRRSEDTNMDQYFLYYNKGPWIWHILRQVLGEDVFNEVLLEFHRRYLLKRVTVDDFHAVCEEISGEPFAWFFHEWLERPGVPILELADIAITPDEDGFVATGTVRQQGDIYQLPVEIGIQMEGQSEIRRIWIESDKTRFEFRTDKRPDELVLDPNTNLLRSPGSGESLKTTYDTGRVLPVGRGAYVIAGSDAELQVLRKAR